MDEYAIRLKDHKIERTLVLPPESCVSLLAAARDGTNSIEGLVKEAAHYDETLTPEVLRQDLDDTGLLDSLDVAFEVDLVANRLVFPGNLVDFARRGVLSHRPKGGVMISSDFRTYAIGRRFQLYDSDRSMVIDEKASLRNEKSLWSNALPPDLNEPGPYALDGVDLDATDLREIATWTRTAAPMDPVVDGKSVYGVRTEGPPTRR